MILKDGVDVTYINEIAKIRYDQINVFLQNSTIEKHVKVQ